MWWHITFYSPPGVVNLNDFEKPITKEFHYDVQFEGVDIVLVQDGNEFLDAGLTGITDNLGCTLYAIVIAYSNLSHSDTRMYVSV